MDLLTFLISITLLGFTIQMGDTWMVLGATLIIMLASRDLKVILLQLVSVGVLYFINGIGMKEYWMFAVFVLLGLAYILGVGKEEAPADPYAGLLGGMGGGMPMGG